MTTKEALAAIETLLRDVRTGNACRFIRKETREAAEKAIAALRALEEKRCALSKI